MPSLQEVRQKYPQYNDMSDEQLAQSLHRKFYSDIPYQQFASKVGIKPATGGEHFASPTSAGPIELTQAEQSASGKSWKDDLFDVPQWLQALKNVGETAASLTTGTAATAAGLLAKYNPAFAPGSNKGEEVKQAVHEAMTYVPRDQSGRELASTVTAPVSAARDVVTKNLGGETAGDVFDAIALMLPTKGALKGSLKGAELPRVPGIVKKAPPSNFPGYSEPTASSGFGAWRDIRDLVTPGGASRLADRFQRNIIGSGGARQNVIDALQSAQEIVPGSKPTASQAVGHLPEGSPIQAHEAMTAKTPGGPSAEFGVRRVAQEAARERALKELDSVTGPMREAALEKANINGVDGRVIAKRIDDMLKEPDKRASSVISRTLSDVKEKVNAATDINGTIDARALYTIRKELGNTIKQHSKDTATWDKKLSSGLESSIQKVMDAEIERAGGVGWKEYLDTYSKGRKAVDADMERAIQALRPKQRTTVAGGAQVSEQTLAKAPNLLSRAVMIANFIPRVLRKRIEPKIDEIISQRYLNPKQLADALQGTLKHETNRQPYFGKTPLEQRRAIAAAILATQPKEKK